MWSLRPDTATRTCGGDGDGCGTPSRPLYDTLVAYRYDATMDIIIYTRQACPLCEKGVAAAVTVFGETALTLVDVDLDLELLKKYTDRVPVIETAEGTVIDEGIISESTLRKFSSRR
jgi:hypothetical protein